MVHVHFPSKSQFEISTNNKPATLLILFQQSFVEIQKLTL